MKKLIILSLIVCVQTVLAQSAPLTKPHVDIWWSETELAGKPVTYVQINLPPLPPDIEIKHAWVELLQLDGKTPFARQKVKLMIKQDRVVFNAIFPGMHMNLKPNFIYELKGGDKIVRVSGTRTLTEHESVVGTLIPDISVPEKDQDRSLARKTAIHVK